MGVVSVRYQAFDEYDDNNDIFIGCRLGVSFIQCCGQKKITLRSHHLYFSSVAQKIKLSMHA